MGDDKTFEIEFYGQIRRECAPMGIYRIFNTVNHFTHISLVWFESSNRVTKVHTDQPDPRVSPVPQVCPDWQDNPAMATVPKVNAARKARRGCADEEEAVAQLDQLDHLASLDPRVILDIR